ncbi:MAG: DUF1587 domain-containing protein [Planctomycetaceae bacterium]
MFRRMIRRYFVLFPCVVLLPFSNAATAQTDSQPDAFVADNAGFTRMVAPFLQKHCDRCHGEETQEADFRVDTQLTADLSERGNRQRWAEVVDALNSHSMPPATESQPEPDETADIIDWVTEQTLRAELISRSTSIVLRRLNRTEYRNTIRDLVGIDFDTSGFPQDPPAGGFDNNGSALTMSPLLVELYFEAARRGREPGLADQPQIAAIVTNMKHNGRTRRSLLQAIVVSDAFRNR